jgi:Zn-dependent carboxypeptidase
MTTQEMMKEYQDWIFKMSSYQMALSIIGIDKMTVAPVNGSAYRDERTAFLAGEMFSIETDPKMVEIVKQLKDDPEVDDDTRRAAAVYYENAVKTLCIPKDEFVAFQQLANESYDKWLEAKNKADYAVFEPYLKKVIEARKKMISDRNSDRSIYDEMLNDFEPNMNQEKYDTFFNALKERLVPLIKKVTEAKQIDNSFLFQDYDIEGQKKFMESSAAVSPL